MAVMASKRGNVAKSARSVVTGLNEYSQAFAGGSGQDIRKELKPSGTYQSLDTHSGMPQTQPKPATRGLSPILLLLLAVVLLAR